MRLLACLILVFSQMAFAQAPPSPDATPVLGAAIASGRRTKMVQPVYPVEAKTAHIQGAVRMRATIDKDGLVAHLDVLEGPGELRQAAVDAVSQWTYMPYKVNGEPVQVLTEITVNFALN
ncbi:MAG: energy transducer TonB [Acidobacteriota bacterium]